MQAAIRILFPRFRMSRLSGVAISALFALGAVSCMPTLAATASAATTPDLDTRYQEERAACATKKPGEDQATCLREAAAAHAAARSGELAEPAADYAENALARCAALPAAERDVCRHRVREGKTEGSVSGGGIIREYREITLPPAAPPQDAAPGSSSGTLSGTNEKNR